MRRWKPTRRLAFSGIRKKSLLRSRIALKGSCIVRWIDAGKGRGESQAECLIPTVAATGVMELSPNAISE